MIDIKAIRENPKAFDDGMKKRYLEPCAAKILSLDEEVRSLKTAVQNLLAERNKEAKEFAAKKHSQNTSDISIAADKLQERKKELQDLENALEAKQLEFDTLIQMLPNLTQEDVPLGEDEEHNVEIRKWGEIKNFAGPILDHVTLGEKFDIIDFANAVKISGSRFVILKNKLALLERALATFMLDIANEYGYQEYSVPLLVKEQVMTGIGQLPKFFDESFVTVDGYRLIPTSEAPLAGMYADSIINETELPIRITAFTPCFRREAGSAGKDTKGIIRNHQFSKVELVSITRPNESLAEHERMTGVAEEVLKRLKLPYRVVLKCSGDTGFAANKTYDIEVWIPSQNKYREISSCSNCGDFQARRMSARYKDFNTKQNNFVHTLNGSALAVGRTIVAIMENYQEEDGIIIPDQLIRYMNGIRKITS